MRSLNLPVLPNLSDLTGMMTKIQKSADDTATMVALLNRIASSLDTTNAFLLQVLTLIMDAERFDPPRLDPPPSCDTTGGSQQ
jgi:hypothetical protein